MYEDQLKERVKTLFNTAIERVMYRPSLKNLEERLREALNQIDLPMRVAIVGIIKTGKSTMLNALLGERIVTTGDLENTFNVSWLKYGDEPSVTIHFKDKERAPEQKAVTALEGYIKRTIENQQHLLGIKYVEILWRNDLLKIMQMIDTPGLSSYHEIDSENTQEFLRLHGEELTATTETHATNADAILYLFQYGMSTLDRDVVDMLKGPSFGYASPLNAIGVLTCVDVTWQDGHDPILTGNKICRRILESHPALGQVFYDLYPISGQLAFGAQTCTESEFNILLQLVSSERFDLIIKKAAVFKEREYPDMPVSCKNRAALLDRFGQYGIWLAVRLIRSGDVVDIAQLKRELLKRSGLPELKTQIISHFGNRALLIKLSRCLHRLKVECFRLQQLLSGSDLSIVHSIVDDIDRFYIETHELRELNALKIYYEHRKRSNDLATIQLSEQEIEQLLNISGERGQSYNARLGLPPDISRDEMISLVESRIHEWQCRLVDPYSLSRPTQQIIEIIIRSYEYMLHQLRSARAAF